MWRWSAPHPEWKPPAPGEDESWARNVGCVLYETREHAVWIDPLAPQDDPGFWDWADARCDGRAAVVLLTIHFHERSREQFVARYGASAAVPEGVAPFAFPAFEETMYWLSAPRVLVPGDRLLGSGGGELTLCPQSWLDELDPPRTLAQMREQFAVLLELGADAVLVSHGEPVLAGGHDAIARALAAP